MRDAAMLPELLAVDVRRGGKSFLHRTIAHLVLGEEIACEALAHLRTEAYPVYAKHQYPPVVGERRGLSYEQNNALIDEAKRNW